MLRCSAASTPKMPTFKTSARRTDSEITHRQAATSDYREGEENWMAPLGLENFRQVHRRSATLANDPQRPPPLAVSYQLSRRCSSSSVHLARLWALTSIPARQIALEVRHLICNFMQESALQIIRWLVAAWSCCRARHRALNTAKLDSTPVTHISVSLGIAE